jgi:serine protease
MLLSVSFSVPAAAALAAALAVTAAAMPALAGPAARRGDDRPARRLLIGESRDPGRVDTVSVAEDARARRSLARELGLAPEQVTVLRRLSTGELVVELAVPVAAQRIGWLEPASLGPGITGSPRAAIRVDRWVQPQRVDFRQLALEPRYWQQWNLHRIEAWAALDAVDGSGVRVAVLDSGRIEHPELHGQWDTGWDFVSFVGPQVSSDGDGQDGVPDEPLPAQPRPRGRAPGHGLAVAGVIAARLDREGVVGIAPRARIQPVRVIDPGGGWESDMIDGIVWAAGGGVAGAPLNVPGARVLNVSLATSGPCSPALQAAIDFARARGAVVVAAAGNQGSDVRHRSPANCRGVVAVAGATRHGALWTGSNRGAGITVTAPSGDNGPWARTRDGVPTTALAFVDGAWRPVVAWQVGTSLSAPHVSAVVALMLQARPQATPAQIEEALRVSAIEIPGCPACGDGLLNARQALELIRNLVDHQEPRRRRRP